jgi:hypothetical protein
MKNSTIGDYKDSYKDLISTKNDIDNVCRWFFLNTQGGNI